MKTDLIAAIVLALVAAGLAVKGTVFSRVPQRRIYWRIKLRLHPGEGFASFAELAWRWSRLAAVRSRQAGPPGPGSWAADVLPGDLVRLAAGARRSGSSGCSCPRSTRRVIIAPPRVGKTGVPGGVDPVPPRRVRVVHQPRRPVRPDRGHPGHAGAAAVFNPFGVGGLPSNLHWDIIAGCQDPDVAFRGPPPWSGDVDAGRHGVLAGEKRRVPGHADAPGRGPAATT